MRFGGLLLDAYRGEHFAGSKVQRRLKSNVLGPFISKKFTRSTLYQEPPSLYMELVFSRTRLANNESLIVNSPPMCDICTAGSSIVTKITVPYSHICIRYLRPEMYLNMILVVIQAFVLD